VPDDPEVTFASMGNYVFTTEVLLDALRADAEDGDSDHDMGGNIIRGWSRRGRRPSTTSPTTSSPARRPATPATGATSARSTPTTTRTAT